MNSDTRVEQIHAEPSEQPITEPLHDKPATTVDAAVTPESGTSRPAGDKENIPFSNEELLLVTRSSLELAQSLVTTTESLLVFEKSESPRLRALFMGLQHDLEAMVGLVAEKGPGKQSVEHRNRVEAFILSMRSADQILQDQKLDLIDLAKKLQISDRVFHGPLIESVYNIRLIIKDARSLINKSFKAMWRSTLIPKRRTNIAVNADLDGSQKARLLVALEAEPFSVGADADEFITSAPTLREEIMDFGSYHLDAQQWGRDWLVTQVEGLHSLEALSKAYTALTEMSWCGEIVSLENIKPEAFVQEHAPFSNFRDEVGYFNDGLRDSILRHQSTTFRLVFVGTENAGKSTFLNAFLGMDILPTAVGPTTMYPCRIHHTTEQLIPELRMGAKYLTKCLTDIRSQNWHGRVVAMKKGSWTGKGLPAGFDFGRLKSRWASLDPVMVDRLKYFMNPDLKFPELVTGVTEIRETLRDLNDFVRLCRNLPMGFDHFEPAEWPTIRLHSSNLASYGTTPIELIDIPGIGEANSELDWHEMINETIRQANLIVTVISLKEFHSDTWNRLPQVITRAGNSEASAIILTKRDTVTLSEEELKWRKMQLQQAFWPHQQDPSAAEGLIFTCSSTLGPPMERFSEFIKVGRKPAWDELWEPDLLPASKFLYPAEDREFFDNEPDASLQDRFKKLYNAVGFRNTLDGVTALISDSRQGELLTEVAGSLVRAHRIGYDIRRMLAAVGMALGDVYNPKSEDQRNQSDQMMELLDLWNENARIFGENIRELAVATSVKMTGGIEQCVNEALVTASTDLELVLAGSPVRSTFLMEPSSPTFSGMEDVLRYLKRCQDILRRALQSLEQSASAEFLLASGKFTLLYSNLQSRVEEVDGTIKPKWSTPVHELQAPAIPLPYLPDTDGSSLTERVSVASGAFEKVERKVFSSFTTGGDVQRRIDRLRFISRALLAVASIIPFVLSLPYWLGKSRMQSYRIRMTGLKKALTDLASEHSAKLVEEWCNQLLAQEEHNREVATQIISSTFAVPDDYRPSQALPTLSSQEIQQCVAASANLLASMAAMEEIETSVQKLKH